MTPGQPRLQLGTEYDPTTIHRELLDLHARINNLGVSPNVSNLKTDYAAADLSSSAAHAAALNSTNVALNSILSKLNLITP